MSSSIKLMMSIIYPELSSLIWNPVSSTQFRMVSIQIFIILRTSILASMVEVLVTIGEKDMRKVKSAKMI